MGDALAVALMKKRNFQDTDFAQFHPGGSLGRRLLTRVQDVMQKENLPIVSMETSIQKIISVISEARLGLVVVSEESIIQGVITDGDIRRAMEESQETFFTLTASALMSKNPKTIEGKEKLTIAQSLMTESKVNSLLVVENKKLIGVVQIYDLGI
jgi:arabinose-5-phosphate isomerase